MPRSVADFFIVHGFVVNSAVLLCGFKQTKGKRHENSDSFDRTAAGISRSVCVNHLWPVVAGGGGMRDTIDMARESWIDVYGLGHDRAKFIDALKHFEALVRADERNRTWTQEHWTEYERNIAAAERERFLKILKDQGTWAHVGDLIELVKEKA